LTDLKPFLQPTETIESDHPQIVSLAKKLIAGTEDNHEKARRLFRWVRDQIAYSLVNPFFLPEHYKATAILDRGRGYCVQKALVLCTLARASGIPSRLVFADIRNHLVPEKFLEMAKTNLFVYHCYTEMRLGNKWIQMTPSFHKQLCEEMGYPLVEFDGHHTAIFPPTDGQGRKFVEYLRHHGAFPDVPLEPMLKAWETAYGHDRVEAWKQAFQ
jgi:transglutaminase-like putative cysteine protease